MVKARQSFQGDTYVVVRIALCLVLNCLLFPPYLRFHILVKFW